MKHFAVVVLGTVGIIAIAFITHPPRSSERDGGGDRPRAQATDTIASGHSWKVSCATVDGGTNVDLMTNVDGGAVYTVTDYTVSSSSSTCVRVGLDSSVDANHGTPIGSGCAGGTAWPSHAKVGRCQSTGAAVVVDVTGGAP